MNEFNEQNFLNYIKTTNISSNEINYLKKLYKVYKSLNKITDNDINNNIIKIADLENEIYTVNNNILSQFDRIKIEIIKIKNVYNKADPLTQRNAFPYIRKLYNILNNDNFSSNEYLVLYAKKLVVTIQLILNIKINFYYASYQVFLEKYRNLELSNLNKIEYKPINNKRLIKKELKKWI